MATYIIKRIFYLLPVMLLVATIVFFLMHLSPGDPAAMLAGADATVPEIEAMRSRLGLDQPLHNQLFDWYSGLLTGDLGESIFYNRPVVQAITRRLEPTFLIVVFSTIIASVSGVLVGIISATKYGSFSDQAIIVMAIFGISIPNFWLGLNIILFFGVMLGWIPVAGYTSLSEGIFVSFRSVIAPSISIAIVNSAFIARITRSSMLETMRKDFVRTARAKGVSERKVHYKHVLKNAIIPIITVIGLTVSITLGGIVVIETVFTVPGMGRLLMQSVLRRDYPLIQGIVMYVALAYLIVNLLVDVLYVFINPRIRYD